MGEGGKKNRRNPVAYQKWQHRLETGPEGADLGGREAPRRGQVHREKRKTSRRKNDPRRDEDLKERPSSLSRCELTEGRK